MITKLTPVNQLKQMFLEILLNKTDKVNDVSKESVLNGIAFGSAKVAEKCLVNQAVIEAHLFPDTAYGIYLDEIAKRRGIGARFSASGSTTYLTLTAAQGTVYDKNTVVFTSISGVRFLLEETITISELGFAYAKVYSDEAGLHTNVDPLTINKLTSTVTGHNACTNEYRAMGGMDNENDDLFRIRIKDTVNRLARTTLSYIEQVFISINKDVLRVHKGGIDADGKLNLILVSVNGRNFTENEFNDILTKSEQYLSLSELLSESTDYSLKLKNIEWVPVDIDFRADINPSYDIDKVRKDIQIQLSKMFDYRFWNYTNIVEWEDLFFAVKNVDGVRYLPDVYFSPHSDRNIPKYKLPRIRSFVMRDLNGNIITDLNNILADFYYPNSPDYSYMNTVLATL